MMVHRHMLAAQFLVLLLLALPCFADDRPADKRVACGGYSYVLPEGFTEDSMHQEYSKNLWVNDSAHSASHDTSHMVTCLTVDNAGNKDFITESVEYFIRRPKVAKDDIYMRATRYAADLPDTVRLYTFRKLFGSETERDFSSYLIELNSSGQKHYAILYVQDLSFLKIAKSDPRSPARVAEDENKLRRERAMRIIGSIRKGSSR